MELKDKIQKQLLKVKSPSRYIGGEFNSIVKDKSKVDVRFAFCFPDAYDVGMSHIGMKILYSLKNARENWWCERVFAPWPDYEALMRENDIPLYGLESLDPIKEFDFIGFTIQYELCYTNILNMLDLAGLPVPAAERSEDDPIVIAGGPCVCNPEPLCDFIDLFVIGEGEEANLELMELYEQMKKSGEYTKQSFLERAAQIGGIYVPSFYDVSYKEDGRIESVVPNRAGVPEKVTKRIIADFDKVFYPEKFVIPFSEIVHDRSVVEVLRGCIRGCRFCQAGFIYRPFREKRADTILKEAKCLCSSSGYEELSLASLSTSDHYDIEGVLSKMTGYTEGERINLALPSMRIDRFNKELMEQLSKVRKSGLTFAPEAGTARLRDVINKNLTEDEIMSACRTAFEGGYAGVKLYFMLGLPTETDEDIIGIADLAKRIADLYFNMKDRPRGQKLSISISCATFVPKPFTPFQFEPQISVDEINRRQKLLLDCVKGKRYINVSYHNYKISVLEAALAKGDRRQGAVIKRAWELGCKFDGWDELYNFDAWMQAFADTNTDIEFYSHRGSAYDEQMPWEHLDYMVTKEFLIRENKKAHEGIATRNCREGCSGCGVNKAAGKECFADEKSGALTSPVPAQATAEAPHGEPLANKKPVRVFFEKKGRAVYISHLDLLRAMQRALKRSELPVWYSEGFNPRIYLNFPLALSLGVEGTREPMDFYIVEDISFEEIVSRLNGELPEGLCAVGAAAPVHLNKEIGFAEYTLTYSGSMADVKAALDSFMAQEKIEVEKRSKKKGMITVDIKPYVEIKGVSEGDSVYVDIRLPAGLELNLNAAIFTDAFAAYCAENNVKAELICAKRTNILCADGSAFE